MILKLSQGAEEDAASAVAWYNKQRDELGYDFLDALRTLLETIEAALRRFPTVEGANPGRQFRHALMRRFPYRIIFKVQDDQSLLVLAIAHTRRHPHYWRRRPED